MKGKLACCVTLVLIALVASCTWNTQLQTPAEMSPKGRAALSMTLYNNAWDNYQAQFAATPQPMSKDMVNYFQGYKAVMVTAEPVVRLYDSTVAAGGLPTPEQEQAIISMIYQLQAMLVKKGG